MDATEVVKFICLAKEGDLSAFEALYRHYHDMILNLIVFGYGIPREDAKEICNNVFVEIWKNLNKFNV